MWFCAAGVGLSLYFWWYHTIDKTPAVFVVLVYVIVCTVAGLLLSMVQGRPVITALSIAVMSAPLPPWLPRRRSTATCTASG